MRDHEDDVRYLRGLVSHIYAKLGFINDSEKFQIDQFWCSYSANIVARNFLRSSRHVVALEPPNTTVM